MQFSDITGAMVFRWVPCRSTAAHGHVHETSDSAGSGLHLLTAKLRDEWHTPLTATIRNMRQRRVKRWQVWLAIGSQTAVYFGRPFTRSAFVFAVGAASCKLWDRAPHWHTIQEMLRSLFTLLLLAILVGATTMTTIFWVVLLHINYLVVLFEGRWCWINPHQRCHARTGGRLLPLTVRYSFVA